MNENLELTAAELAELHASDPRPERDWTDEELDDFASWYTGATRLADLDERRAA